MLSVGLFQIFPCSDFCGMVKCDRPSTFRLPTFLRPVCGLHTKTFLPHLPSTLNCYLPCVAYILFSFVIAEHAAASGGLVLRANPGVGSDPGIGSSDSAGCKSCRWQANHAPARTAGTSFPGHTVAVLE